MGKVITQIIDRFDGGLTEDKRSTQSNKFALTKHFDAFTYPHKLVPYFKTDTTIGGVYATVQTYKIVKFLYAPRTASTYRLFGFGVDVGTTKPGVYALDVDAGDIDNTAWAGISNGLSTVTNRNEEVFFYYKGFIYMWTGARYLVRADADSGDAFNDSYFDYGTTYSTVAAPVHHTTDDVAYFFVDNLVYKLDNTSWSLALTLPSNLSITSACSYGNYLAIACVTKGTSVIQSTVYLWDRDSSLALLTERIDFGLGTIIHLITLDNVLLAVLDFYANNIYSLGKGKLIIKRASGNFAVTLNELTTDNYSGVVLPKSRVVKDNKLYFPARVELNSDARLGIWALDSSGRITLDFVEEAATSIQGIFPMGNLWWIAYNNDGSISHSDSSTAYSTSLSSIYESLIFNGGDAGRNKQLISAGVMTEALPTAGQIVLKYRKNEETSWTTIFTNTTDSSTFYEALTSIIFKEIQFQILSTGGGVITGLKFKYELLDDGITD